MVQRKVMRTITIDALVSSEKKGTTKSMTPLSKSEFNENGRAEPYLYATSRQV